MTGTSAVAAPAAQASASATETVIVSSTGLLSPVTAVLGVLGTVVTQFHLIDAVKATIPTAQQGVLAALPGITVTPDLSVTVQSTTPASTGPHPPSDAFLRQTGAGTLAADGDTGQGVTVAVLDTGIDTLPDFSGRLVGGVDLTGEDNPFSDDYGHGTFVAGLIGGDGASSNGQYSGEAPGADLVSIKVAGASGSTHLSTLISGLQWAVDHENAYGIKVLNISLGFRPLESTIINPLDQAVEAAWNSGITVVTSAGNAGPSNGTILSPGDDPLAITVGALDDLAQPTVSDDEMNDFSSVGPTAPDGWAKPDLVTSGRSVVSLAAPGSTVYNENPSARTGSGNFVGSGTSFSAAITSGAAALVLSDHPDLTPDQVKARLLGNTGLGPVGNPFADGHGALDAYAAATSGPMDFKQSALLILPTLAGQTVSLSPLRGISTWDASRWSGTSWTQGSGIGTWNGYHWVGSAWNGWAWTGSAWNTGGWTGSAWNSGGWTGSAWNGGGWTGSAWNSCAWTGSAWNSSAWE
ncbi:MAG: S8 family peptidase [Actinomycetota bacterium]|nr:S8 family peptidase [Actinomycetota bacterium]